MSAKTRYFQDDVIFKDSKAILLKTFFSKHHQQVFPRVIKIQKRELSGVVQKQPFYKTVQKYTESLSTPILHLHPIVLVKDKVSYFSAVSTNIVACYFVENLPDLASEI